MNDRFASLKKHEMLDSLKSAEYLADMLAFDELENNNDNEVVDHTASDMIKKYFHNPIGILPYFPPVNQ
jgi:hypothetical protein